MFRLVKIEELDLVWQIIMDAKKFIASYNSPQWQGNYPTKEVLIKDINTSSMHAYVDEGIIKGIIVLKKEFTKNYVNIDGCWEYPVSDDDLVIHRIAVKEEYRGLGLGVKLLEYAIEYARDNNLTHIKTDTHPLNIPMQKSCERVGFKRVGIVYSMLEQLDKTRYAYELILR